MRARPKTLRASRANHAHWGAGHTLNRALDRIKATLVQDHVISKAVIYQSGLIMKLKRHVCISPAYMIMLMSVVILYRSAGAELIRITLTRLIYSHFNIRNGKDNKHGGINSCDSGARSGALFIPRATSTVRVSRRS